MAAQAELLESGLTLIGATAVEDRLQEGVPQAITTLSAAGIKVCPRPLTRINALLASVGHCVLLSFCVVLA